MARDKHPVNDKRKRIPEGHKPVIRRRLQAGGSITVEAEVVSVSADHVETLLRWDEQQGYAMFDFTERKHLKQALEDLRMTQRRLKAVGKRAADLTTIDTTT